jgi:hypothetical protein
MLAGDCFPSRAEGVRNLSRQGTLSPHVDEVDDRSILYVNGGK